MPAYWSLLSVTGPQFYRADSNTPRSVYFKIRQIAAVLEWRLHLGLKVENANLLLNLDGRYLGEASLNIPYVAPNTAVTVPVDLSLKLNFSELAGIASEEFFSFFKGEEAAWSDDIRARLMVQLPLGLQLPIYIPEGYRHEFKEE